MDSVGVGMFSAIGPSDIPLDLLSRSEHSPRGHHRNQALKEQEAQGDEAEGAEMKTPTLDTICIWNMTGGLEPRTNRENWLCIAGFATLVVCGGNRWIPEWVAVMAVVTLVPSMFTHLGLHKRASDRRWKIMEMAADLPFSLQTRGRDFYGYGTEADIAILECHQSHMPGDCPLCGAE